MLQTEHLGDDFLTDVPPTRTMITEVAKSCFRCRSQEFSITLIRVAIDRYDLLLCFGSLQRTEEKLRFGPLWRVRRSVADAF